MASSSSRASQIKYVLFVCLLLISKLNDEEAMTMSDYSSSYPVVPFTRPAPEIKYDVFVSFRGADIRQGFLSHLIKALSRNQIVAFVDDKLERGDEVSPALHGAIERSFISLIIFSQDYASSHWCLEELVKIVECKEKDGQIVIPVFYNVDPSDVRHQKGTYGNAFAEHEKISSKIRVQIWRSALNESANLSGFHSSKFGNDAELLEEIVKCVSMRLNPMHQVNSKGLLGIGKRIAHLESLLRQESEDVRVIGIWGMGGIGKTTLAEEVFNRLCSEYEGCCFLANVREESGRHGIISLKNKLFSTLLEGDDLKIDTPNGLPHYVEKRLGRMKVLIVLDDVNDSEQLEILVGTHDWFGSGSRIIVTTRDKQVLAKEVDDNAIYEVGALDSGEALQLFNLNAFKQNHLEMEYYELSKRVVDYAKGIPLVLKVLGHLLRGKDKEIWESQLEKLKKMPSKKVHNVMRLSYDDLDREEQKIFLDIACFFDGLNLKVDYHKFLLKDHDYSVAAGLERLKDKALITISEKNVVSMHDIIQEMAWEIVRQESTEDPGNRSRLWDPDDIYQVLKNNKGTEAFRSISLQVSAVKKLDLSPHVFAKMSKLRFLDFYNKNYQEYCVHILLAICLPTELMHHPQVLQSLPTKIFLTEGLQSLPTEIYVPQWRQPLPIKQIYLPQGFQSLLKLISLPQGLQSFPTELRYLRWMHYPLKSLPEKFSAEKLVILDLSYSRVEKLWHGVQNLVNLKVITLHFSSHLMELPDFSKATNLEEVDISYCAGLTRVHPSVFYLDKLEILDLSGCIALTSLKSHIHLSSLRYLILDGCKRLKEFSVTSENMIQLDLQFTSINKLPSSFGRQSKLETVRLGGTYIESLPASIKHLTRLRHLYLGNCRELQTLPELPPSLETLDASGCTSLKTLVFPSTAQQLRENKKSVVFWHCFKLDKHSLGAIELNAQINIMTFAYQHLSALGRDYHEDSDQDNYKYKATYVYPGSRVPEWLVYRTTHDYITIDLSSAPHSPLLGFIFCFVVPKSQSMFAGRLKFIISDGEGEGDSIEMHVYRPFGEIEMDHVCVMYDKRCSRYLNSRAKNQPRFKIKVTAVSLNEPVVLKGFGVSPINALGYHNFIQQMGFDFIPNTSRHNHEVRHNWRKWHTEFHAVKLNLHYFVPNLNKSRRPNRCLQTCAERISH